MTISTFTAGFTAAGSPFTAVARPRHRRQRGVRPGACNIGPAEIARRRRAGHVGLVATVVTLGVLAAIDAPPVAGSSSRCPRPWQVRVPPARLHFCAASVTRRLQLRPLASAGGGGRRRPCRDDRRPARSVWRASPSCHRRVLRRCFRWDHRRKEVGRRRCSGRTRDRLPEIPNVPSALHRPSEQSP